jgi:hypothetical protein
MGMLTLLVLITFSVWIIRYANLCHRNSTEKSVKGTAYMYIAWDSYHLPATSSICMYMYRICQCSLDPEACNCDSFRMPMDTKSGLWVMFEMATKLQWLHWRRLKTCDDTAPEVREVIRYPKRCTQTSIQELHQVSLTRAGDRNAGGKGTCSNLKLKNMTTRVL